MPIAALPQAAISAIGSLSVLSDSYSVIKELVENALDACATSIAVDISPNTLDVIQVKDNGLGIPPDDHELVCKRSFTSKIQTLDDLNNVGGSSLGFRGEALASLAEMCNGLVITTRIQGQAVAAVLSYARNGELLSSAKTSHPVGTTVRVSGYLKPLPVRKQAALKCASKTVSRIRNLLQSYALSRPEARFSFKILNSKGHSTWVYAPNVNATVNNALLKVVGSDVMNHCLTKGWPETSEPDIDRHSSSSVEYASCLDSPRFVAVAPKPGCDYSKVANLGQYVSVDKRPLSVSRGIGKDIVKLFKSYLRSRCLNDGSSATIKEPFLCLQICCPRGSYDANIEPSKDDVLFAEPASILSAAEALFQSIYGEYGLLGTGEKYGSPECQPQVSDSVRGDPKSGHHMQSSMSNQYYGAQNSESEGFSPPTLKPLSYSRSLKAVSNNNGSGKSVPGSPTVMSPQHLPKGTSPWTLAKTNTSLGNNHNEDQLVRDAESHLLTPLHDGWISPWRSIPAERSPTASRDDVFPSPSTSETRGPRRDHVSAPPLVLKSSKLKSARADLQNRDMPRITSALDVWLTNQPSTYPPESEQCAQSEVGEDELSEAIGRHFGDSRRVTTTHEAPSTAGYSRETLDLDMPDAPTYDRPVVGQTASTQESIHEALDFERRKKEAIQLQKRQFKQRGQLLGSNNSPHENRYLAAKAQLSSVSDMDRVRPTFSDNRVESILERQPDDPRIRLICQSNMQNERGPSTFGLRIRRLPSNNLPLEKVPAGSALQSLMLVQSEDIESLSSLSSGLSKSDDYTSGAPEPVPCLTELQPSGTLSFWAAQLSRLIENGYRAEHLNDDSDLRLDLEGVLQKHVTTFATCSR